ncbi:MAG: thioredoxin family protein [Planctomycetes bacterium]|nr:thioredoxin family protein [Planctomycetota bacterium]
MIRYLSILSLLGAGLLLVNPAEAGKYNRKITIGQQAPAWENLPGVDGKTHSLSDLKDKDVVVMVITCNHCPVAQAYQDRIIAFAKKYTEDPNSKVALVAINVNNIPEDRLPQMKERAREKGFPFPYLYDQSQKIGHEYGASVTPEFYVLDKDRKIVYTGAMDDSMNPSEVTVNYLEPAVEAALKGEKPATTETRARGCGVKYDTTE